MPEKLLPQPVANSVAGEASSPPWMGADKPSRPWILHPFLIAMFPVLSVYAHNVYEVPPSALILPLVLVLVASGVLLLGLRILSRDAVRSGMMCSLLLTLFYAFRSISQQLETIWHYLNGCWVARSTSVHPLVVLGFVSVPAVLAVRLFYLWSSSRLRRCNFYLNAFTFLLVLLPTFSATSARLREPITWHQDSSLPSLGTLGKTPDIYFIVLDGYARSDIMKELFDLDNEPFLERLEKKGFFVGRQSTSNYCQTRLSICSTLNADYLDKLMDPNARDLLPITGLIRNNRVNRLLQPLGYKFVTFSTGFDPTDHADTDLYLTPRPTISDFHSILLELTPFPAIMEDHRFNDRYSIMRDRILYVLDQLPAIGRLKQPTFTFAHLVSPHPPFIFGENGEDLSPRLAGSSDGHIRIDDRTFGSPQYMREAYRKQASFIIKRIEKVIDEILASSPAPPIIVLQSDHGSWLRYHPDDVEKTDLRERFGILNCVYIPDGKYAGFTDHSTSVNTFRLILSNVFGADLPVLDERSYFSPFFNPLVFTDITERLHSDRERKREFKSPDGFLGL